VLPCAVLSGPGHRLRRVGRIHLQGGENSNREVRAGSATQASCWCSQIRGAARLAWVVLPGRVIPGEPWYSLCAAQPGFKWDSGACMAAVKGGAVNVMLSSMGSNEKWNGEREGARGETEREALIRRGP